MRKFHDVYKEKQNRAQTLFENKVVNEFKDVYSALLDKYGVADIYKLNEETQMTFLGELNTYWSEEDGISDKGKRFIATNSEVLGESSTYMQKKSYFKKKASSMLNETIRQSGLKWKFYDIVNEMYTETGADSLPDVLSADAISDIVKDVMKESFGKLIKEIRHELNESQNNPD